MIAKVALLFAVFAAAHATLIAPGLLNAGIVNPGLLNAGILAPAAIKTGSVVAIPGAVTTDRRIIGTTGIWNGAPLLANGIIGNGLIGNGLIGNGLIGNGLYANGLVANGLIGNGLIGGAPLAINKGIVSPLGWRSAGILAGPGIVKTIL